MAVSVTGSFTLKGKVTDKDSGEAISGAVVSIGAASVITSSDGTYAISSIDDSKVYLEVSMSGYASVGGLEIAFSGTSGTLTKDVALTVDPTTADQPGFKAELTVGEGKFKEVSALAVGNGDVYVLGKAELFGYIGELKDSKQITGIVLRDADRATPEQKHLLVVTAQAQKIDALMDTHGKLEPPADPTPPAAPATPAQ